MKRIFIAVSAEPGGDLTRMMSSARALLGNENIRGVDRPAGTIPLAFLAVISAERIRLPNGRSR